MDRRPAPRLGRCAGRRPGRSAGSGRPAGRRTGRAGAATGPLRPGGADPAAAGRAAARRLRAASAARRSCLQAMAWSGLKAKEVPPAWVAALANVLDGEPANAVADRPGRRDRPQPATRPRTRPSDLASRLLGIAADATNPDGLRLDALAALPGGLAKPDQTLFTLLDRTSSTATRPWRPGRRPPTSWRGPGSARSALPAGRRVAVAGPVEVDRLLTAFEQSTDEVARPEAGQRPRRVVGPVEPEDRRAQGPPGEVRPGGPEAAPRRLYARLNVDAAKQKARLEQLVATLSAGDIRRGQLVFHSEKAACYSCHAIGYRGGNVGPDLTRIGSVRSDRDLLEAIVFPSVSFVRSFEPIAVATQDGKVYNGLIRGETADELILATGVNQEARIARRDIDEIRPSTVSVMPAGLDQQLTPQELADLVAFLKACKWIIPPGPWFPFPCDS